MNTKLILGGIALFVVGVCFGSAFCSRPAPAPTPSTGMHQMPDGSMMMNAPASSSMATMMHDMNAALLDKQGNAFDQTFLAEMIVHHEGAVDMAELAKQRAVHPELQQLADEIIQAQTREINMMKEWQQTWNQ